MIIIVTIFIFTILLLINPLDMYHPRGVPRDVAPAFATAVSSVRSHINCWPIKHYSIVNPTSPSWVRVCGVRAWEPNRLLYLALEEITNRPI